MFLILVNYQRPLEEVDAVRPAHAEFLDQRIAEGTYVLAGRRIPPEGGVIVARGSDPEALRRVVEQDPYVTAGVASYELVQFDARKTLPGIEGDA